MFELKSKFKPSGDQPEAIKELSKNFDDNRQFQTLLGVTGSGKTFTVANIIQKINKKVLVLAPNKTLAAQLFSEFKEFFPNNCVEYFVSYYDYYQPEAYVPGRDVFIEKDASINDEIDKLRHSATRNLIERDDVIVVSSVSCIYGIGSPDEYSSMKITLFVGDELDREDLLKELISIQFERNDIDFSRGKFRVRGDVVEIFPSYEEEKAIKIEFYGDEIESISIIDPLRGKTLHKINKVTIYPTSHYVVGESKMQDALKTIKIELRERLQYFEKENKLLEAQRLEQRTMFDLEMMEQMGFCSGIENYSRHLTGMKPGEPPPTLIDFFEKDFLLVVDESHITVPQIGGMYKGDRSRKETLVEHGFRLPSAMDNRPLQFEEFESKLDKVLYVSATPGDFEIQKSQGEIVEQIIRPTGLLDPVIELRNAENQVDDIIVESKKIIENGFRVLITTLTKKMSEKLTNFMLGAGIKVRYLHSDIDAIERVEILRDLRAGEFDVLVGINLLREGLDLPEVALVAILDADKEGFLRSERSLIQTIGRAARNKDGKVILYSYKQTKSMNKAIEVTNRRRDLQADYNLKNNITPVTVEKNISGGVIEVLRGEKGKKKKSRVKVDKSEKNLSIEALDIKINELKQLMKTHAKALEFEKAAAVRDEIKELSQIRLTL